MKPYYHDERAGITIYCGDCLSIAQKLTGSIAVVSDPPYGMNENTNRDRFSGGNHPAGRGRRWEAPVAGDSKPFDPTPWLHYDHVILWGANHYASRLPVGSTLLWIKKPDHLFGTFLSDAEVAWRKGGHGVYAYRKYRSDAVREEMAYVHPCQKPVPLMAWCIDMVPPPAVILDPYMGSGTTIVAAREMGRRAIGIEIEERYCEIAVRRLAQEVLPL